MDQSENRRVDDQRPIPEQGQIVTVRQRRYVVSDVQRSALEIDVLSKVGRNPQHLVSLTSMEAMMHFYGVLSLTQMKP